MQENFITCSNAWPFFLISVDHDFGETNTDEPHPLLLSARSEGNSDGLEVPLPFKESD